MEERTENEKNTFGKI